MLNQLQSLAMDEEKLLTLVNEFLTLKFPPKVKELLHNVVCQIKQNQFAYQKYLGAKHE